MNQSKYAARFAAIKDLLTIRGNTLLVEVLPREEIKTEGGLILGTVETFRATAEDFRRSLALVLLTGEAVTETKAGELIMLPFNPLFVSEFPGLQDYTSNTLALIEEDSVIVKYTTVERYEQAKLLLNPKK